MEFGEPGLDLLPEEAISTSTRTLLATKPGGGGPWGWRAVTGHFRGRTTELVDRLDRVSRKYSLLINVDKTNDIMARDGIACHILIQNEQLEQVDTFPYLVSLITEDCECTMEFRTRLNRGQAIGASHTRLTHTPV